MFSGPHDKPPKGLGAYGIVVFPSAPTTSSKQRFEMICEAFTSSLAQSRNSSLGPSRQFVTVWPIYSDADADDLNSRDRGEQCKYAVLRYGDRTARAALKNAEIAGRRATGVGPFLFGWAPSDVVGERDANVLVINMSDVRNLTQAQQIFLFWKNEIEGNGAIWRNGWNFDLLLLKAKFQADNVGEIILGPKR